MQGKILSDTFIAGEPVYAGDVVDVDKHTYAQLLSYGRIEPVAEEPEEEKHKPQLTFTKRSKKADKAEPPKP